VRVALKSIPGVDQVDVSLSKGEAVATLTSGNSVRYEQLLRAIEKNGFVVKGTTLTVDGTLAGSGGNLELQVSGSGDHFRLEPMSAGLASGAQFTGKTVEISGTVPEAAKGKNADVLRYTSLGAK
jgi:copper chaperone CopZ